MTAIRLIKVLYIPKVLEQGVLYVSDEYRTASHLCACGCGSKVVTPISPAEWTFSQSPNGPTLWPSIGNWQMPCRAHYIIRDGKVLWAGQWTDSQIQRGRDRENERRAAHYDRPQPQFWTRLWSDILAVFK